MLLTVVNQQVFFIVERVVKSLSFWRLKLDIIEKTLGNRRGD
ncbi:hypothetical protein ACS127_00290 [Amphibacillus sp. Q70]